MSATRPTFRLTGPGGTSYALWVNAPGAGAGEGPFPAVAVMDGDRLYAPAVTAYRRLRAQREIAPLLLVGVGYGAGFGQPGNERIRDCTPTRAEGEATSGGADAFVAFLANELWPALAQRYPVDRSLRGIAGHSLGALGALHALFQRGPLFNRAVISAPSIWWDQRVILTRIQRLQETGMRLPARVFLSAGGEDSESMTGDLVRLERQLALHPFPALEVISTRFPGRDHYNVLEDAYLAGLRAVFG